jgi:hypothetical protein
MSFTNPSMFTSYGLKNFLIVTATKFAKNDATTILRKKALVNLYVTLTKKPVLVEWDS